MATDIESDFANFDLFFEAKRSGAIDLLTGSCLDILPTLGECTFDAIITSPPYANRYDYTRTYALELAAMNVGEQGIKQLRQAMLSCTVENKAKNYLAELYSKDQYQRAMTAFQEQAALQLILRYLSSVKKTRPSIIPVFRGWFATTLRKWRS